MATKQVAYRAAHVRRPLMMLASRVPFLSFCKKEGLWKATQDGMVLLMTLSHSVTSSGLSLWGRTKIRVSGADQRERGLGVDKDVD